MPVTQKMCGQNPHSYQNKYHITLHKEEHGGMYKVKLSRYMLWSYLGRQHYMGVSG
jgi:hypothetical protein